jgi:hypothetical protein
VRLCKCNINNLGMALIYHMEQIIGIKMNVRMEINIAMLGVICYDLLVVGYLTSSWLKCYCYLLSF